MRLITFGCSFTYGYGLIDCISEDKTEPGPMPSALAWPSILAKKLNCSLINLGNSGISNKEIWHNIVNFNFEKNDISVVLWTYFPRSCIIRAKEIQRIKNWVNDNEIYFERYHDDHDSALDFYCRLNHIYFYLNSIGIENFNFVIDQLNNPVIEAPSWNRCEIQGRMKRIDLAEDNKHFGINSHKLFAERVYRKILMRKMDYV